MKRFALPVMIAAAIIFQAGFVYPLTQPNRTLKELVQISPVIITGKVTAIDSKIETEGKREVIYTYVTLDIQSVLKGEASKPTAIIKMLGGRVGSRGGWSEELFAFKKDEEVLLFLHLQDESKNIWKVKSFSGRLPVVEQDGVMMFDCSNLRPDEVSSYGPDSYFEREVIINRINKYLSTKGGN